MALSVFLFEVGESVVTEQFMPSTVGIDQASSKRAASGIKCWLALKWSWAG